MKRRILSLILAVSLVVSLTVPLTACGKSAVEFEVSTEGFATSYVVGAEIDYSPISIIVHYDDGSQETIEYADFGDRGVKLTPVSTETAGEKNVRIEFAGQSKLIPVTVTVQRAPQNIEIDAGFPLEYTVGETVDYSKLKVTVYYNDNTTGLLGVSDGVTHSSIDTSETGEQDFTAFYAGLSDTVKVTVSALLEVESIAIKDGTFASEYDTADDIHYENIVLVVNYVGGTREEIKVSENADIVLDRPQIAQADTEYTLGISYRGKSTSTTFTVASVDTKTVTSAVLSADNGALRVRQGDAVDYSRFVVTVTYEGESDPVEYDLFNARIVYTPVQTAEKIEEPVPFSVTFNGAETNALNITVAYVTGIAVENLKTEYVAGETFDPSCTVVLTYSDSVTETRAHNGEGVVYSAVDTSSVGDKTFTVTYKLVQNGEILNTASCTAKIAVEGAATLTMFSEPQIYIDYRTNKGVTSEHAFFDTSAPYMAGDDNPLVLLPRATDADHETMTAVQTKASVELKDGQGGYMALDGEDLAAYVAIDGAKNYYDFTAAAVGKTFRITVVPAEIYELDATSGTSFTVEIAVVDGYNVYNAQGLAAFDNRTGSAWDDYKPTVTFPWDGRALSAFAPDAIVLHGNITVTAADLPPAFFWHEGDPDFATVKSKLSDWYYENGGVKTSLADCLEGSLREGDLFPGGNGDVRQAALYEHIGSGTVYGNYMTVTMGETLKVVYDRDMYDENSFSKGVTETHFSAFAFNTKENAQTESHSEMRNVHLVGNTQRSENNGPQGIMMVHNVSNDLLIENVVGNNFFTNVTTDLDFYGVLTIDQCKFYDSFSNMVYDWSTKSVTVRDSVMSGAGGPLLLAVDHDNDRETGGAATPVSWTIENSRLTNWVTGQEAWFALNNVTPLAGMLSAMASKIGNAAYNFVDSSNKLNMVAALISQPSKVMTNDKKLYASLSIKDGEEEQKFDTAGTAQTIGSQAQYAPLLQCGSAWGVLKPTDKEMSDFQYVDIVDMMPDLPFGKLAEQANKYAGIYLSPGQNEGYLSVILQGIGV